MDTTQPLQFAGQKSRETSVKLLLIQVSELKCEFVNRSGQQHMAEGLKAVGAKIGRGLEDSTGQATKAGHGVVVDDHDAKGGVAEDDRPCRERDIHDRKGRAQRHAGDDAGQGDGQDDQQADLFAPEKPRLRHRRRHQRAKDQRQRGRQRRDLQRQIQRRPDIGAMPRHGKPFGGQAGGRELVGFVLGREGVEEDQEDRQVEEEEPPDGGDLQSP